MAERRDANVLEIVIGQPAQQIGVDVVGAEYESRAAFSRSSSGSSPTAGVPVRRSPKPR
jgi:hypothetical protein